MKLLNHKIKKKAILDLLKTDINSQADLMRVKRKISKKFGIAMLGNSEIIKEYRDLVKKGRIKKKSDLERIIRKRAVRTMSGVAPVAVLTKPYPCPGNCAYCPSEKDVPQSYLSNEPAVMRAIRCEYDPYTQVQDRLRALAANGHEPTKIELIIIGGTWSYLPKKYKHWYIASCFRAANDFVSRRQTAEKITNYKLQIKKPYKELQALLTRKQKRNEKTKYKIIGITVETRPDFVDEKELWKMRELGVTRVEIGVQAIDDKILKLNKRGHAVKKIVEATGQLKNFGFKVTYHVMPGLPGSTPAKDVKMFKQLFTDERFQPDQIKFYPTVVTRGSLLYRWYRQSKYKPYSDKVLRNLIIKCKQAVPKYVRIIRLIRDIPGESIVAGNRITNLRQVIKNEGIKCNCIRCREPGQMSNVECRMSIEKYKASGGEEYFISFESKDGKVLYGFCRLRLPAQIANCESPRHCPGQARIVFENTALVRELHVYGELVSPSKDPLINFPRLGSGQAERKREIQHSGLGKRLLREAERHAKMKGFRKIAIISGIGVRDYYRKQGYRLYKTYMIKKL